MSFDRTDIKSKAIAFCDDLNIQSNRSFKLYPFSNEYNFGFTINKLSHYEPIKTEKLRIAILVGESHFLSLLPELQKHTDVIILNDINPKMHSHFNHLLKCLNEANTIQEFENKYRDNHPIKIENQKWYMNDSFMLKVVTIDSLSKRLMNDDVFFDGGKDKIFTSSLERFQECKEAAKKIMFVHAKTDLLNENKCDELFSIIKKHDAVITLINMTNLHYYDDKNTLISLIQKMSNDTLIMYSLDEKPGANVECTMSQLESTISQVKEYVDYLNLFHKMKQLKIEIEQKKRLETFKRIISRWREIE
ncbi:MAG: hypothetical protein A3F11_02240 [Gammaproteobacteria bacterium RIFCSPHIGHO2_12_FULL_37_14]|nr:MAG: hypothetical protein A3F11_02240 [Gammaproteobacteria bacterium RIFCSPHIGHO2_12_FULL_37_14]